MVQISPMFIHVQVCESKMLSCNAGQEVSRRHTRGEFEDHAGTHIEAGKGSTLDLKPRVDVTRSPKQVSQWSHTKDFCPPKINIEPRNTSICCQHRIRVFT